MLHRSTIRQNNSYGNTWLAMHSDIPSGIVRTVQASLYIDTPVWVRLFQCKNNKLTVILSTEYGDIAEVSTTKSTTFVPMTVLSDVCAGASIYTGVLNGDVTLVYGTMPFTVTEVEEYGLDEILGSFIPTSNDAPELACGCVTHVQRTNTEDRTAITINGVATQTNRDVRIVVDSTYFNYTIEDGVLYLSMDDAVYRLLTPEPTVTIETTNPVYTINGKAPDSEGNINISFVSSTGVEYVPVVNNSIMWIDTDTSFIPACDTVSYKDPLTTDNTPALVRIYKEYPLDIMFDEAGNRDMALLDTHKYEVISTGKGISLFDVNTKHDEQPNVMDICI